ncbi:MAG TPA: helix-turn-helix domain-containing protein, partial [Roseiflexaceae bacterium]|nr:helix-turn-helix domain-containing protein [Roseiflexaceae bacterium]
MEKHRVYRQRKYAFGKQLLTLRMRLSLSQTQIAETVGVHRRSFQNWEAGESYPKAETLQRLIAVLLEHGAFANGQEREEATALWRTAAEDGNHLLADFDEAWFAALAQTDDTPEAPSHTPTFAAHHSALLDWGEAIAVPNFYGRDRDVDTLQRWVVDECCRVVALLGLGGMGKSSLAIRFAEQASPEFDAVLFRSLQNGLPLGEALDQIIDVLTDRRLAPPQHTLDKIDLLIELFRKQRCLLILDN